jgi:hypothetical protein
MPTTPESPLPLDQVHAAGSSCPVCRKGTMRRDGIMDGNRYPDGCSRPWYVCNKCGEEMDGETVRRSQKKR